MIRPWIGLSLATLAMSCTVASDFDPLPQTDPLVVETPATPEPPAVCDAGDDAWVMRAMPLIWGRKPHGAGEVRLWSQMAAEHGREAVVRAMALDPEYLDHWRDWFTDALYVARTGDKQYGECFRNPRLDNHFGALAQHLALNGPEVSYYQQFNMADVILEGLLADNVSVIYQANLFARMNRPVQGANVSLEELEYNRRINFGEVFFNTYLGRNLDCMGCHNSEISATDHPDPAFDRTWQLPGHFEKALLGVSQGITPSEAYSVFRFIDVVRQFGPGFRPWNMARACGAFSPRKSIPNDDFIDQNQTIFIDSLGAVGSVYDVERYFAQGVQELGNQRIDRRR